MSDARLRELRRRWRESGLADDEAAYLRERARMGDLDSRRLELAAICGYPAARSALGTRASGSPSLQRLLDHVRALGPELTREVALCGVEVLLELVPEQGPEARAALARVAEWLESPSETTRQAALAAFEDAREAARVALSADQVDQGSTIAASALLARSTGGPSGDAAAALDSVTYAATAWGCHEAWGPRVLGRVGRFVLRDGRTT